MEEENVRQYSFARGPLLLVQCIKALGSQVRVLEPQVIQPMLINIPMVLTARHVSTVNEL